MDLVTTLPLAALAVMLEACFGYPDGLFHAVDHPVTWIGGLVSACDAGLNRASLPFTLRRACGFIATGLVLSIVTGVAFVIVHAFASLPSLISVPLMAFLGSSFVAQRSLYTHVYAVAESLDQSGLDAGRKAVAKIVGRDVDTLDPSGVARAAIESLAENFSDAVVAPAFFLALFGLPGGACYKAINTADSMIGHKTARYADFGRAAARLDDWVNFPAARLAAFLILGAALIVPGASARNAWRVLWRDARRHRSPNAGWPEAAMAGALGLRLSGPRVYEGEQAPEPWIGDGNELLGPEDIERALKLYRAACAALWALAAAGALVVAMVAR